jgi:acetyl-CoA C-acetyltransferase
MNHKALAELPDNTPIIVGAGQHTEHFNGEGEPLLSPPLAIAAEACRKALADTGVSVPAGDIDTIAVTRLFSDSAPHWKCPFGRSDNPPQSVARHIGADPSHRIYSNAGGTQPMQILAELFIAIARGEKELALLTGGEAIANQRHAQRSGLEPDWNDSFNLPMDERKYTQRMASKEELASGMFLPAHYYALIENMQAHRLGHNHAEHLDYMGRMLAPFSETAANNPYAFKQQAYDAATLADQGPGNYPISLPYSKLLVAQDSVNQGSALLLCSVGKARDLGIDHSRWIFVQAYAEGEDDYLIKRRDPSRSEAMDKVLAACMEMDGSDAQAMDLIDIYSCFPCAVQAACDVLDLPAVGGAPLTVTGGLPFFGGPGNNYVLHPLAESVSRLRGDPERALVTANGGILSKHAAAVLGCTPAGSHAEAIDWQQGIPFEIGIESVDTVPVCEGATEGELLGYTVIDIRDHPSVAIILGQDTSGARFLAHNELPEVTELLREKSPIGRRVSTTYNEERHRFSFID